MTKRGADDFSTEDESSDGNVAKESAVSKSYDSPVKAAAESSITLTQSLLTRYHSPLSSSSSSSGGGYSHVKTVNMKVNPVAEFCVVKFQISKNATQAFFDASAA